MAKILLMSIDPIPASDRGFFVSSRASARKQPVSAEDQLFKAEKKRPC
jgi:hypothetical protein